MKAFVAVTDNDWFRFLRARPELTEVNFWQPGGGRNFRALDPGQPLLFKLHYPQNFIVGGGFFATFSILPVSMAWETFGPQNGVATFEEMRRRIAKYRREDADPRRDYEIGCIVLEDAFFLEDSAWIPAPQDFSKNVVVGKGYDLTGAAGADLWSAVLAARAGGSRQVAEPTPTTMYGEPALFRPRLGQGAFRVMVTDAYQRHCAVTGEKTLPVLEAAHIRPVAASGQHRVDNGLLLRSDIHTLFDRGYVTVTPDHRFRVSRRLREDWQNGRPYYQLDGQGIWVPPETRSRPSREELEWHADTVFLG
ncbi:MAG: HNH endonuclease [Gemmatimonadales bacterium]